MDQSAKQQLLLDLFRAYFEARKNKRQTVNALAFEKNFEDKLFKLYEDILKREYKIGPSICFIIDKPVKREIFAADFRDRIVHHLIFNYLNPIFEKTFIYDSYSCRLGKGTSQGIKRVDHFMRSATENYQKDCWILKLDIRGYFMAMDRNILYTKISDKLKIIKHANFDLDLALYLIRLVIFNDPTKNCRVKGSREGWAGLPKSKSLFFAAEGKGFPIGNLSSQLFSNIYLNEFDHFVREKLGLKYYGRYVDDMIFFHKDKGFLKGIILKVAEFLQSELKLTMHPNKIYLQHFKKGVYFLGAFIKPYRIYIGRKTKQNFYAKIRLWNELARKNFFQKEGSEIQELIASANSYFGIIKHYHTNFLRKKMANCFNAKILKISNFSKDFQKITLGIFVALGLIAQVIFVAPVSAAYVSQATVFSANLLANSSASSINAFNYNISALPGNSSVRVQFSKDNSNWYSATGVLNSWSTLSTTGGASLSLASLAWSGTSFYYKIQLNPTSDLSQTPSIEDISLDYTAGVGNEKTFIFDNAGNVGIGIINPTAQLDVLGAIKASDYFTSDYFKNSLFNAMVSNPGLDEIRFGTPLGTDFLTLWAGGSERFRILSSGNIGIGTGSPSLKLEVAGGAQLGAISFGVTPGQSQNLALSTVEYVNAKTGGTGGVVIGTSGQTLRHDGNGWVADSNLFNTGTNVGIGTTVPGEKLTISKDITNEGLNGHYQFLIQGAINRTKVLGLGYDTTSNYGFISAGIQGSVFSPIILNSNGGNVGIGTTTPSEVLDVVGNINLSTNGFPLLISSYNGADSEGLNVFMGGGGASSVGAVGSAYKGSRNVFVGIDAGLSNTIGYHNSFYGMAAGQSNTTGYDNTFLGKYGGRSNTTGSGNTFIGYFAGSNLSNDIAQFRSVSDTDMILIGRGASKDNAAAIANGIAIGNNARVLTSNQAVFGNDSITSTLLKGNVGIGTTNPTIKFDVPAGQSRLYALQISSLSNASSTVIMADPSGNLFATSTSSFTSSISAFNVDLNMQGHNILNVNKLTVNTIDPLYTIKGLNYSTYAASIVGGVKEEYVGRLTIDKEKTIDGKKLYEKTIDFAKLEEGEDLWVWHKVVDFSRNNVEVLITPYGSFSDVYYLIENDKLIFRSSAATDISYRLIGKRIDWLKWPTKQPKGLESGIIIN